MHAWGGRASLSTLLGTSGAFLVHSSVSRRARIPSLREMYSSALGRFVPNPDLEPEIQWSAELGGTLRSGTLERQGVAFLQTLSDGIVRVSVEGPGGTLLRRVNRDRTRTRGVELLGAVRERRVEVESDLTLQRVSVSTGSPDLPDRAEYEPSVHGSLRATSSLAGLFGLGSPARPGGTPGFQHAVVRASLSFTGSQHCLDPGSGDLERIDPSAVLNVGTDLVFGLPGRRSLAVGAGLANAGDGLSFDQCGLPRPGRTLQLTVRVR